jgi:hypothetical protein
MPPEHVHKLFRGRYYTEDQPRLTNGQSVKARRDIGERPMAADD